MHIYLNLEATINPKKAYKVSSKKYLKFPDIFSAVLSVKSSNMVDVANFFSNNKIGEFFCFAFFLLLFHKSFNLVYS